MARTRMPIATSTDCSPRSGRRTRPRASVSSRSVTATTPTGPRSRRSPRPRARRSTTHRSRPRSIGSSATWCRTSDGRPIRPRDPSGAARPARDGPGRADPRRPARRRRACRPGGPGGLARGGGPAGGRARSAHREPAELAAPDAHGRDRLGGSRRAARAGPRSDRRDRVRGRPRRRARRRARGASRGPRRDRGVRPADHRVARTTRGGADMIRSFRRFWRYLTAALEGTLDELLDPRVQIEQAIGEAKRRHALLAEQAAAVLGNERELDIRINRAATEAARLRASARQALVLADRARANGETTRAAGYESSAAAFAGQLTVVDASVSDLQALREKASAVS